jgi:hypothetical protein
MSISNPDLLETARSILVSGHDVSENPSSSKVAVSTKQPAWQTMLDADTLQVGSKQARHLL